MALNSLSCADVPLSNYSLTQLISRSRMWRIYRWSACEWSR